MIRPLGAIPSRPDQRDYPVRRFMAVTPEALPVEFESEPLATVLDQDIYGMCVAFTLCEVKAVEEARERGDLKIFAPAFIYGRRDSDDYQGEGMEPRQALKCLQKYGVPPWEVYPRLGDYQTCRAGITEAMKQAALPYVIQTYARATTVDELKAAIYHTGPCMIAIPIYESFDRTGPDGVVPHVQPGEPLRGYHAMMVYGWTSSGFWKVQNSWGASWGNGGRCLIPFDYFTLSPDAPEDKRMEAWTVVDKVLSRPFPDVEADRWSAEAIAQCKAAGIMLGYPDGQFHPTEPVTREQLAVILARALKLAPVGIPYDAQP